jgi:release factor glutamine methyltransferase
MRVHGDERVLIPRPDTEILIELIAQPRTGRRPRRPDHLSILDIGTGSGVIAISLAIAIPNSKITATDINPNALEVAKLNAASHNAENRVTFIQSDLFNNLTNKKYDIIVSNPPYIRDNEPLPDSVIKYEPHSALFGGTDGLDFYRRIIKDIHKHLNENGEVYFEIGQDQGAAVSRLLREAGFTDIKITKDLANRDRVVSARW